MALHLILAQTNQSQNFPADCQMRYGGRECSSRPIMVDLPSRYPSLLLTKSIPHMFPKWGGLHESFVAMALVSHTTPSISQWWYSHHLVLLYHLIRLFARVI